MKKEADQNVKLKREVLLLWTFSIGWLDNAQKSVEKVIEWREKNEDL